MLFQLESESPEEASPSFHCFTVDEYHRMIAIGILEDTDRVELIEGHVVVKMPRTPAHDATVNLIRAALIRLLPEEWAVRTQQAVTLDDSEPEPDVSVARGRDREYVERYPTAADTALIVEVAGSSLTRDREERTQIYARSGISCYWIVNLNDRRVEVYDFPSGPTSYPTYGQRRDFGEDENIEFVLDESMVITLPVADLLP